MSVCRGEVDEALVLLIEANTQQAQQAGATQVAEVLTKLSKRIQEEKERKLPEEQVNLSCSEIDGLVVVAEIDLCWLRSAFCERYSGSTPPRRGRLCCTRLSSRSRREMRKEEFWKVRVRFRVRDTENILFDVSITEG